MSARKIDYKVLENWEDRLDKVYRMLENARNKDQSLSEVENALADLNNVRREIDWELVEVSLEAIND